MVEMASRVKMTREALLILSADEEIDDSQAPETGAHARTWHTWPDAHRLELKPVELESLQCQGLGLAGKVDQTNSKLQRFDRALEIANKFVKL